jgi:hypothetical protein
MRDRQAQARALESKQRRKKNRGVGPYVHPRRGAQPEEEEEEEEADEAAGESANGEAVTQSVACLKAISTTCVNRPLQVQLAACGLDQENERLVERVVEALCQHLTQETLGRWWPQLHRGEIRRTSSIFHSACAMCLAAFETSGMRLLRGLARLEHQRWGGRLPGSFLMKHYTQYSGWKRDAAV